MLNALYDQRDLPYSGSYAELVDSLDVANCIRLIDRKWNDVFRNVLPLNCRTWAKELMGVRNIVAHIGQQDLEQPMAERALDTMALLCKEIDQDGAEELREIYRQVRAKAEGNRPAAFSGLAQPETESKRGALKEGSLLRLVGTDMVKKTALTRKVTYGVRPWCTLCTRSGWMPCSITIRMTVSRLGFPAMNLKTARNLSAI